MQIIKSLLLVIMLAALITAVPLSSSTEGLNAQECTTIVALENATSDGSVLLAKNRDLSEFELQWLYYSPRTRHPPGSRVKLQYIDIPQAPTSWAWVGAKSYTKKWGAGMGINEWGLAIASNDAPTREPLEGKKGLHDNDVARLVLETTKNPREGVELIGRLITWWGHSDTGEIYTLANSTESWIVEAAGRHWVAVKVRDFEVIANQFQITTDWDLASGDLVEYAIAQGWCESEEEFDFARCYSPEGYPFLSSQTRIKRGLELLEPKLGKICPEDLMEVLRDHYEGTNLYQYPPHENPNYRTICINRTCSSMVCHLRPWLPRQLQLMWYSHCSPCESVFVPVYAGTTEIPESWRSGHGGDGWANCTSDSAWWRFKQLQHFIDENYMERQPGVRKKWDQLYQNELAQSQSLEKKVEGMLRKGRTQKAEAEINKFVNENLERAFEEVKSLTPEISEEVIFAFCFP
jgi:secernin